MRALLSLLCMVVPTVAHGQLFNPPSGTSVDLSGYATKTEVQAVQASIPSTAGLATTSALNALAATVPVPAAAIPPMETSTVGAIGTAGTYRPATAVAPRITRAAVISTTSGGVGTVTWATALPSNPVVTLTPVDSTQAIDCQLTSAPTTTTVNFRCFTAQTLAINLAGVTAGLNLSPVTPSAAGLQVHVLAIPVTQ